MALINCYECKKEISDKAPHCIHCGYDYSELSEKIAPQNNIFLKEAADEKPHKSSEGQINKAVDIIFGLLYVFLLWNLFFGDLGDELSGGAAWFGILIAFAIIYFVQKMIKAVLGTIGRAFDDTLNKKK